VARKVSVIVAEGVPSAFAAKAATKTIPIVFTSGADPVKLGLVESLSRPNSNLTGVSIFANALGPKDVELLHGNCSPRWVYSWALGQRSGSKRQAIQR
jgi:putative tryptophan/tyrosine transport system substrate-binding protein